MVLIGSWKTSNVSKRFGYRSQVASYLDLIHNVEAVLVALVGERDSDQSVHNAVGIGRRALESIAEVGAGVRN